MVRSKKTVTKCKNCPEAEAGWHCKKCKMYMCETCKTKHDDLFASENHSVISVASLTPFDLFDGKCAEHSEYPLDLICNDCKGILLLLYILLIIIIIRFIDVVKELFCLACKETGKHKGHNTAFVRQSEDDIRTRLANATSWLESNTEVINCASIKVNELEDKFDKDIGEMAEHIEKEFEKIITEVNQRKDILLRKLEEMKDKKKDELEIIRGETKETIGETKSILEESKKVKEGNELCRVANAMLKAEKSVKDMEDVKNKLVSVGWVKLIPKFIVVALDKLIADIREFGSVKIDSLKESLSNFHVTHVGAYSISLSWDELKGAENYIINMKESKDNNYNTVYRGQKNNCETLL